MHVQLDGIERAMRALAIRGIEPDMLHHVIHSIAHHHAVVCVPQMPVVVDPTGLDLRNGKRGAPSRAPLNAASGAREPAPG